MNTRVICYIGNQPRPDECLIQPVDPNFMKDEFGVDGEWVSIYVEDIGVQLIIDTRALVLD